MNPQVVERLLVFVEPQAKASKSGKDPGRVAKQRAQSLGNHLHVAQGFAIPSLGPLPDHYGPNNIEH